MADYNPTQKIIFLLAMISTIFFFALAFFNLKERASVLGYTISINGDHNQSPINLNKIVNIDNASIMNLNNNTSIISSNSRIFFNGRSLNIIDGAVYISTESIFNLEIRENVIQIIQPGIFFIDTNKGFIYSISGKLKIDNDNYLVEGQSFYYNNPFKLISVTSINDLKLNKEFRKIIDLLYKNDTLPGELNMFAPLPSYIKNYV